MAVEVYRYVDSKGRVHLTDRPPHDGYQLIRKAGKKLRAPRINFRDKDVNRKRFSGKIAAVARRYRVPEALLHAVVAVESAYDPNAVSRAGAVGLMQLMPSTARRYGVVNRRHALPQGPADAFRFEYRAGARRLQRRGKRGRKIRQSNSTVQRNAKLRA